MLAVVTHDNCLELERVFVELVRKTFTVSWNLIPDQDKFEETFVRR